MTNFHRGGGLPPGPGSGGWGLPAHGIVGRQTRVKILPCPILHMRAVIINCVQVVFFGSDIMRFVFAHYCIRARLID